MAAPARWIPLHLLFVSLLSACGGSSSGAPQNGDQGAADGGGSGGGAATEVSFFNQQIQPQLDFCRTCHIPGGVADADDGRRLMLSSDAANDLSALKAAWQALGGGVDSNLLLREASDPSEPHSGGKPWRSDSAIYQAMQTLLACWESPDQCHFSGGGEVSEPLALLGSSRATHVYETYCADKPDNTALPVDPRSTIQPGRNAGRAVHFNAWFEECQADLPAAEQNAKTCGEYRQRRDKGYAALVETLAAPTLMPLSAEDHDNRWQKWGLSSRPENFEALYSLRYGMNYANYHNPYPLPGEDPNSSNGGSGKLPMGLRQLKDENGRWTGEIGSVACFQCHGGQIDSNSGPLLTDESLGLGNANLDYLMVFADNSPLQYLGITSDIGNVSPEMLFNMGVKQRGQNNAVGAFELLAMLLDYDTLGLAPNPLKALASEGLDFDHPTAQAQDTPPWWNYSHRARKFFDAGQSVDATRILMAAGQISPEIFDGVTYRHIIESNDQDVSAYILSTVSPEYPGNIDTALAEQGAVLFHTKDLWAEPGNANAPRPEGGNGSCASCHGAYSPRYVNDPEFLEDPALEGLAAHISPLDTIGTDPARADNITPYLRATFGSTYFGSPEGDPGYVAPEDKNPLSEALDDSLPVGMRPEGACGWEQGVIGYQAPPLYGVWATAPYLHNGSVPTIDALLDSSQRPAIWQRALRSESGIIGFDQHFERAYDSQAMGWKYQALSCEDIPGSTQLNCNPVDENAPSLLQLVESFLKQSVNWTALLSIPDPSPGAFDKRLVFDSRILGNSRDGHSFSDVLTDTERRAVIEYLKTL